MQALNHLGICGASGHIGDMKHADKAAKKAAARARALDEAAQRRIAKEKEAKKPTRSRATEKGGRAGPEPTRYGDWEKDGIACDF